MTKFTFSSRLPAPLRGYAKEKWTSWVFSKCHIRIFWFHKKHRYKVLVSLWQFFWSEMQFNRFVDIATTGRHRRLGTIYIRNNLFHQSKLERDVQNKNTHIVLFEFLRDVMQVSTLSAQFCIGSELVDWYQDAKSVRCCHFLIDMSPHTDDKLCYCTSSGSVPSKFYNLEQLKHSKSLEDEATKSLYFQSVPIFFPQMQTLFLQSCSKEIIRFLWECLVNLLNGNLKSMKRNYLVKFENEGFGFFL